jgi:uncharacterized protein YjbI with pentapeptide repeats
VSERRPMEQEELDELLAMHQEWLSKPVAGDTKQLKLDSVDLKGLQFGTMKLNRAVFRGCDLGEVVLTGSHPFDAQFEIDPANGNHCILTNTIFDGAHIQRCVFNSVLANGTSFNGAHIEQCHFNSVLANGTSFNDVYGSSLQPQVERTSKTLKLMGPVFENCDLRDSEFRDARIDGASFINCDLRDVNFENAEIEFPVGLTAEQFGGANLKNATLPEHIAKFEPLETAREAAKRASRVFSFLLLLCAYALITVFATSDAQLITNAPTIRIPNIGTTFTTRDLFFWLPIVILGVYVYFQFYLYDLWDRFSRLPAVFPDGVPIDRKAHPWPFNVMTRKHMRELRDQERHAMFGIQWFVTLFLAWWMVPFAALLLQARYLCVHVYDEGSVSLFILLWLSTSLAFLLHTTCSRKLRHSLREPWNHSLVWVLTISIIAWSVQFIMPVVESGKIEYFNADLEFEIFGSDDGRTVELRDLNLRGANARHAQFRNAILTNVDLTGADIRHASFSFNQYGDRDNIRFIDSLSLDCIDLRYAQINEIKNLRDNARLSMKGSIVIAEYRGGNGELIHWAQEYGAIAVPDDSLTDTKVDSILADCICSHDAPSD